eukprot:gene7507-652_t
MGTDSYIISESESDTYDISEPESDICATSESEFKSVPERSATSQPIVPCGGLEALIHSPHGLVKSPLVLADLYALSTEIPGLGSSVQTIGDQTAEWMDSLQRLSPGKVAGVVLSPFLTEEGEDGEEEDEEQSTAMTCALLTLPPIGRPPVLPVVSSARRGRSLESASSSRSSLAGQKHGLRTHHVRTKASSDPLWLASGTNSIGSADFWHMKPGSSSSGPNSVKVPVN